MSNGVSYVNGNGCSVDEQFKSRLSGEPPKISEPDTSSLLITAVNLLEKLGIFTPDPESPVVNFKHPAVLQKHLSLTLDANGTDDESLVSVIEDIVKNCVKTNHRFFHNQLYGACDPYGLVGSLLTEALNTNQYTFEVAPSFTLTEQRIIMRSLSIFGFAEGDGIFAPGGSMSNMYGMMLARHKAAPEAKQKGIASLKTLVVFTSQDAHYSTTKGVNWLGIGTDNLIKIKCDPCGRMIPEELEKAIISVKAQDKIALFVNATAGTTVLGAFDPLDAIADVCARHSVWLHVDACWGGSLIFSKKHKKALNGIHRVDSIAWNPHKMLGAPLQCSLFLTKHKGLLHQCNCAAATYLFQQDKFYDVSYDTGDKSLQCGRKVDGFKLWLMWRARGDAGFEQLVNNAMACADYFRGQISVREGFRLVIASNECTNVCFWFIPKRMRNQEETDEWWKELDTIAPQIKEKLSLAGSLLIGYQPLRHRNLMNFFRMVVTCHPQQTTKDMDKVITLIEEAGQDL